MGKDNPNYMLKWLYSVTPPARPLARGVALFQALLITVRLSLPKYSLNHESCAFSLTLFCPHFVIELLISETRDQGEHPPLEQYTRVATRCRFSDWGVRAGWLKGAIELATPAPQKPRPLIIVPSSVLMPLFTGRLKMFRSLTTLSPVHYWV